MRQGITFVMLLPESRNDTPSMPSKHALEPRPDPISAQGTYVEWSGRGNRTGQKQLTPIPIALGTMRPLSKEITPSLHSSQTVEMKGCWTGEAVAEIFRYNYILW